MVYNTTLQSISQSTTINYDVEDYVEMKNILKVLSKKLSERAMEDDITGKMLSISIRYFDFRNAVRSINLDHYTNNAQAIYENALLLFDQHYESLPVRHLGIGLGSLQSKKQNIQQLEFFEKPKIHTDILKELNKNIEGSKLVYAS